jgi:hypothetical protein
VRAWLTGGTRRRGEVWGPKRFVLMPEKALARLLQRGPKPKRKGDEDGGPEYPKPNYGFPWP